MDDDRIPPEPEEPADEPEPVEIAKTLGDEEEVRATLNRLGITYDLPLQTMADLTKCDSAMYRQRSAEELAKIMRLYPDKNSKPVVVETTGEVVRVYLPDNGRDTEE